MYNFDEYIEKIDDNEFRYLIMKLSLIYNFNKKNKELNQNYKNNKLNIKEEHFNKVVLKPNKNYLKKPFCYFYEHNCCKFGFNCKNKHEINLNKNKPCINFINGCCINGRSCDYKHSGLIIKPPSKNLK